MYTCRIAFASHRHRFRYIRSSIKRKVRNRRSNIVSKIAAKKERKEKQKEIGSEIHVKIDRLILIILSKISLRRTKVLLFTFKTIN